MEPTPIATLTVPLSPIDNVATFHLAPGFCQYALYCQTATTEQHDLVNTQEQLHALDLPPVPSVTLREWQQRIPNLHTQNPTLIKQHYDPPNPRLALEDQYYQLHCSLGHIHHDRMQLMVKNGTLPRRFLRCRLPMCASCLYGKATRKPWRSRSSNNTDESDRPTAPGQCISVDQYRPTQIAWIDSIRRIYPQQYSDIKTRVGKTDFRQEQLEYIKSRRRRTSDIG